MAYPDPPTNPYSGQSPRRQPPLTWVPPLIFVSAIALILVVWFSRFTWFGQRDGQDRPLQSDAASRLVVPRGDLSEYENTTIELFREASKSVVFVSTAAVGRDLNFNLRKIPKGSGSGIIWDDQGHVVTNYHVVEGANRWQVTLADHSQWEAKMVGRAPDRDIAVLKIDAPKGRLRAVPVGTSANLLVGQSVLAIGNPFGFDQTLTTGVISGLGREIEAKTGRTIQGVIQTDAAINPGNSGGPLLDSAGRLIGVNTAIYSPTGASAGIGFAIPVDSVNRIVPLILQRGDIVRPILGVRIAPDSFTQQLELPGVLVGQVLRGSPADAAGVLPTRYDASGNIRWGDVIVRVADHRIANNEDLFTALEERQAGETIVVTVLRDAGTDQQREVELSVRLQAGS